MRSTEIVLAFWDDVWNAHDPDAVDRFVVDDVVVVSGGQEISKSALTLRGKVPGMSEAQFVELANKAKAGCPVSKALGAIEITLDAKLEA